MLDDVPRSTKLTLVLAFIVFVVLTLYVVLDMTTTLIKDYRIPIVAGILAVSVLMFASSMYSWRYFRSCANNLTAIPGNVEDVMANLSYAVASSQIIWISALVCTVAAGSYVVVLSSFAKDMPEESMHVYRWGIWGAFAATALGLFASLVVSVLRRITHPPVSYAYILEYKQR
jgi:4-amino-4-deoxy-L-arabinose transferase-like glycosyltransferase